MFVGEIDCSLGLDGFGWVWSWEMRGVLGVGLLIR